jgi:hypothetical protein
MKRTSLSATNLNHSLCDCARGCACLSVVRATRCAAGRDTGQLGCRRALGQLQSPPHLTGLGDGVVCPIGRRGHRRGRGGRSRRRGGVKVVRRLGPRAQGGHSRSSRPRPRLRRRRRPHGRCTRGCGRACRRLVCLLLCLCGDQKGVHRGGPQGQRRRAVAGLEGAALLARAHSLLCQRLKWHRRTHSRRRWRRRCDPHPAHPAHTHTHTYIHTYTHAYVYTHMHTRTHTCAHIHIGGHTDRGRVRARVSMGVRVMAVVGAGHRGYRRSSCSRQSVCLGKAGRAGLTTVRVATLGAARCGRLAAAAALCSPHTRTHTHTHTHTYTHTYIHIHTRADTCTNMYTRIE